MSKKHFEALAAALKEARPFTKGYNTPDQVGAVLLPWEESCLAVAGVCARFNPNFDRARFLKACGVEV
jgi:hypothetical protein